MWFLWPPEEHPTPPSPFPVELGKCTEFFLCHSGHELPGLYLCVNLHTIQEGTICRDNFKTQVEKELAAKAEWEAGQETARLYDKAFRLFIDGIEDKSGFGLHTQGVDSLIGEYIVITDKTGKSVGAVPAEDFDKMREELEHYASYLVHLLVKNSMVSLPVSKKGGVEHG